MSPEAVADMARKLNVRAEDVVEMETRMGGHDVALEPSSDDEDQNFAPITYLADPMDEPGLVLEHDQSQRAHTKGLENALAALDARARRIIEARWLREQNAATLHELADEFGVSAERIRQIEGQAMKKMRALMAPATA
jgi:RNA polymerase sigma-32 factor